MAKKGRDKLRPRRTYGVQEIPGRSTEFVENILRTDREKS